MSESDEEEEIIISSLSKIFEPVKPKKKKKVSKRKTLKKDNVLNLSSLKELKKKKLKDKGDKVKKKREKNLEKSREKEKTVKKKKAPKKKVEKLLLELPKIGQTISFKPQHQFITNAGFNKIWKNLDVVDNGDETQKKKYKFEQNAKSYLLQQIHRIIYKNIINIESAQELNKKSLIAGYFLINQS